MGYSQWNDQNRTADIASQTCCSSMLANFIGRRESLEIHCRTSKHPPGRKFPPPVQKPSWNEVSKDSQGSHADGDLKPKTLNPILNQAMGRGVDVDDAVLTRILVQPAEIQSRAKSEKLGSPRGFSAPGKETEKILWD